MIVTKLVPCPYCTPIATPLGCAECLNERVIEVVDHEATRIAKAVRP